MKMQHKNATRGVGRNDMKFYNKDNYDERIFEKFKSNCKKCFGYCCVALYFSTSEGFPSDKVAGEPCSNLEEDFSCAIHSSLLEKGLKGCTAYDCFGAGQKVAQVTYDGLDWHNGNEKAKQMFDVFSIMRQLHEMLWYLSEALLKATDSSLQSKIIHLIKETEELTYLNANAIIEFDIEVHRNKVNSLLRKVSEQVQARYSKGSRKTMTQRKTIAGRLDLIGQDLRRIDLMGATLAGALLIAADLRGSNLAGANLIGADLRNADIRGADLSESLYITQSQVNAAIGDSSTRLPAWIEHPNSWCK
jgi:uncharacterized protein YjbI with pentapeptide repeats